MNRTQRLVASIIVALVFVIGGYFLLFDTASNPTSANSGTTTSDVPAVQAWVESHSSALTALNSDGASIINEANGTSYSAMETTCAQLKSDAASAQQLPAIPNTTANASLQKGVSSYETAAQDCLTGAQDTITGTNSGDAYTLNTGGTDIEAAVSAIHAGTNDVNNVLAY